MLYELIAIVRPGTVSEVRDIAFTIGSSILRSGGVIRGFANWGVYQLPSPITSHQTSYAHGHHFVVRYDLSGTAHQELRKNLLLEPRMLRTAHVRLGNGKLPSLASYGAPVWRTQSTQV
ncbi:hypothetical protein CDD82_5316 [Ophiocordyceps australis]|uniref:Ribosomal protein S6 n=1 Tax=Ophiocordyceps australis TaxID=1399860 RepID=A0A2C5Z122_9HYPO|nr:hypothetical protein CDD82_5316 [Ophiocordyceps australis]